MMSTAMSPEYISCFEAKEAFTTGKLVKAGYVIGKAACKFAAKAGGKGTASFASSVVGPKISGKLGAKLGGKAAAHGSSNVVGPGTVIAATMNAGINAWIIADISHHAEVF